MISLVHSMGLLGIDAFPVEVEASLSSRLPAFDLVGLPGPGRQGIARAGARCTQKLRV